MKFSSNPGFFFLSQFKLIAIIISLLISDKSMADVPSFDIAEIEINKQKYYLSFETPGHILGDEFCYYSYDFKFICDAEDVIERSLRNSFQLFLELHIIDLAKFSQFYGEGNEQLFILKNQMPSDSIQYEGRFRIHKIIRGNTAGYVYSEELKASDNSWIAQSEIEAFFDLGGNEPCEMKVYGIKGSLSAEEKKKLKIKLDTFLIKSGFEEFQEELKKLYTSKIIMIGFCSC